VENTLFQFYGFNQNGVASSTFKNIDLTRQYGVEGIIETRDWPLRGISIEANGAYTNSVTLRNTANPLANGVSFPRIPTWRINGHARYDVTAAVQASLGLRYASRPNTDLFGLQRGCFRLYRNCSRLMRACLGASPTRSRRRRASTISPTCAPMCSTPISQRTFLMELGWHL
jgi:iron complex outermembrane receptor protein